MAEEQIDEQPAEGTELPTELEHKSYWVSVLGPFVLLAVLLLISVLNYVNGEASNLDRIVVALVPALSLLNFLGVSQPRRITATDDTIAFYGIYGRKYVYDWKDVTVFKLKEFAFTDRIFIRVGTFRPFSGRYWVDTHKYPGLERLIPVFRKREVDLHPERKRYQKRPVKKK